VQTEKLGLKLIAEIPYDPKVEEAIGDTDKLLHTTLAKKIEESSSRI
jgi:hypothetical protein